PDFEVYPNPADDRITVRMNNAGMPFVAVVADITGKELLEAESETGLLQIDCSKLKPGMYSLIIRSTYGVKQAKKLVVTR
ncbi:MAG: T9SS type A sorting domain-containing protein, partial [Bacteroidetes bacterium]|nr:T9SS type A sorting domain-containing protein [Bacteroidota bacterium]